MKIVTIEEMRKIDAACAKEMGITTDTLMENAGLAVAQKAREMLGEVQAVPVLVLVGPGNNGGDGLVAARCLQEWGAYTTAYLALPRKADDPNLERARAKGVSILDALSDPGLKLFSRTLGGARLVIDAALGTGRLRPLEGAVKEMMSRLQMERAARRDLTLLALDIPTGMDADTGVVDPATPCFDATVTLAYPKTGLFRFPGAARVGRLHVVDIGIPEQLAQHINRELLTPQWVAERLPSRPLDAHKGAFGRLLIVAGSRHYVGAAALAAEAAYRVGAGLVTIASPSSIYPILAATAVEATHLPLPEMAPGRLSSEAALVVEGEIERCSALLVGCGMGQYPQVQAFLERLLLHEPPKAIPTVVDADALNSLARVDEWWRSMEWPAILTPHPGEMARLTGESTSSIQGDRLESAREWAGRWGKVVVLKGAFTVVAPPQGPVRVSPFANPALASAGTGDVLAGAIAGLLAQGVPLSEAAGCGVYIHGAAGEEAREEIGEVGVIARDLLSRLPKVISSLRGR